MTPAKFGCMGVGTFATFRADVGAGDAHFDAVLLHLHLVAGTRSDTRAVVHHEIICRRDRRSVSRDAARTSRHRHQRVDSSKPL